MEFNLCRVLSPIVPQLGLLDCRTHVGIIRRFLFLDLFWTFESQIYSNPIRCSISCLAAYLQVVELFALFLIGTPRILIPTTLCSPLFLGRLSAIINMSCTPTQRTTLPLGSHISVYYTPTAYWKSSTSAAKIPVQGNLNPATVVKVIKYLQRLYGHRVSARPGVLASSFTQHEQPALFRFM